MKLAVFSDLHIEFERDASEDSDFFECGGIDMPALKAAGLDAVLLAGDIGAGIREGKNTPYSEATNDETPGFAKWLKDELGVDVYWVAGNHDFYNTDINIMKSAFAESNSGYLENIAIDLGEARLLGCTLWTDFGLYGRPNHSMRTAEDRYEGLEDFRCIRRGKKRLQPIDARTLCKDSVAWLEEQLALPYAGKTIVMTHHAPSEASVPDEFKDKLLTAAYASHLDDVAAKSDVWVHGHLHKSQDYSIGRCRVVCNPRGYIGHELNPDFNPALIIEI